MKIYQSVRTFAATYLCRNLKKTAVWRRGENVSKSLQAPIE